MIPGCTVDLKNFDRNVSLLLQTEVLSNRILENSASGLEEGQFHG